MSSLPFLLEMPWVRPLGWMLIHFLWQGALIGLAAAIVFRVLGNSSPRLRYAAGLLALCLCVLAPISTFAVLMRPLLRASPVISTPLPVSPSRPPAVDTTADPPVLEESRPTLAVTSTPHAPKKFAFPDLVPWTVPAWMACVSLLTLRLAISWSRIQIWRWRAQLAANPRLEAAIARLSSLLSVGRRIPVLLSRTAPGPLTMGFFKPVILLPVRLLTGLPWEQIEAILAHELAHIRRHDYLVNLLQCAVEVVLFYHPVVWWLNRQIRQAREECCDELASSACGDRAVYARAIVALAQCDEGSWPAPAAAEGDLLKRIRALTGRRPSSTGGNAAGLICLLATAILTATLAVNAKEKPSMPPPQESKSSASITFTILQADSGAPLEGASIELANYSEPKGPVFLTDESGLGKFPVPETKSFNVRISKKGFVPKLIEWRTDLPEFHLPKELSLKLEKERTIGGIVVDEEGNPIAGVKLLIIARGSSTDVGQAIHDDIWEQPATTDAQGQWTFTGVAATTRDPHIRLAHPQFVAEDSATRDVKMEEYFAKTAKFTMNRGHVIEGIVRDGKGAPLEGATIFMNEHGAGSTTEPEFTTDAQGRYRISNAPSGTPGIMQSGVLLTFFKKGFAPELRLVNTGARPVTEDIVLQPGNRLSGQVLDENGKPLQDVYVFPNHWRGYRPFSILLKTDADGRFVWEDAPPDEVIFDVLKEGHLAQRGLPLAAGKEVTLTLRRPLSVKGTVVDADTGEPIPDFKITPGVKWSDGRSGLTMALTLQARDGRFAWVFDDPIDLKGSDGKIVAKGSHFLRIQAPGYAIADSRSIENSDGAVELEVRLRKAAEVTFQVRTPDGKPAAGAKVAVSGEGNPVTIMNGEIYERGDRIVVKSGSDGRVALPALETNPVLVIAHPKEGFATPTLKEAQKSDVTLAKWGRVVVSSPVIRKGENPPFYLNYEAFSARNPAEIPLYYLDSKAETIEDGQTVFKGVKPGVARIGTYNQPENDALEITVPSGGEARISPMELGIGSIQGKLILPESLGDIDWSRQNGILQTSADPKPWPTGLSFEERQKWLNETPEGKSFSSKQRFYFAAIQTDGTYNFPNVAPGKYELSISIFSGQNQGQDLRGFFQTAVIVPAKEELAKQIAAQTDPSSTKGNPGHLSKDVEMGIRINIDPPFFKTLGKGDKIPSFTSKTISGDMVDSSHLAGRKAILAFYVSHPEELPNLRNDARLALAQANNKGVRICALNCDDEKLIAEKTNKLDPLACDVAWIDPEVKKEFGLMWSPAVFAIGADGTILGKFQTIPDALNAFP